MFKPLSFWIGLRYTRAKRKNGFISFISLSSMLGLAVGVAALIIVLSVMSGFQKEVSQNILKLTPHANVFAFNGNIKDWKHVRSLAEDIEVVKNAAPYIDKQVMLSTAKSVSGGLIQGIVPEIEENVTELGNLLQQGSLSALKAGEWNILLGDVLAQNLGVSIGDKVTVITPETRSAGLSRIPTLKQFTLAGIFHSGMHPADSGLSIIHLADAQKLFRMGTDVTAIRLEFDDMLDAPVLTQEVIKALPNQYLVSDWTRQYANYFRAVRFEKTAMFIILMLIVTVAAFNIVSTLVMVVQDKRTDIAILRTLGMQPSSVMMIFIVQGIIIGFIGVILGLLLGLPVAYNVGTIVHWIEIQTGSQILDPTLYNLSALPSEVIPLEVAIIAISAFLLAILATLYPAWSASRTQPAEALRYE
jgi:lipoprotein-releasing system permease protein